MTQVEIWLMALALAMDCFVVSIASGIIYKKAVWKPMLTMAFLFGFFQALNPLLGWWGTNLFRNIIESVDHWLAFAVLAFLGVRMIVESFKEEEQRRFNPHRYKVIFMLAIATSIDALAIGVSFAFLGVNIWYAIALIGVTTGLFSAAGVYIGKFFAGLTLVWGVISAAYGISILLALFAGDADVAYSPPMFTSLMVALGSSFSFCAFVYMLSAASKRGAAMKSMLLLIVVLPILVLIVRALPGMESMSSIKGILEPLSDMVMYLPVLGPDIALAYLGLSPISTTMGLNWISLIAFANMVSGNLLDIGLSMNAYVMTAVAVVIGILCLVRGFFKIRRRDM